ncbi:AraC family transcriptional regulator [Robbsia andropogonis]|uniref:AraC family transcriptional regulator n=2 Tax=Robbsia andropogonis TaxID=28092 RepID=UPI003D1D0A26
MPPLSSSLSVMGAIPDPISFRTQDFPGDFHFPSQRAPWGKVLYAVSGVVNFDIAGVPYFSPPAYAIWIPPKTEHESRTLHEIKYASIYVRDDLCRSMPSDPCTIVLSDLIKAIMRDFAARQVLQPKTAEDSRLAAVLLDQLKIAPQHDSYLPTSNDLLIKNVITALQAAPGDRRSLTDWAILFSTTERTLSRKWKATLGLSFNEWRQRLRLVVALTELDAGRTVQEIASELGYSNTSAFISMFRQLTGSSPQRMRKSTLSPLSAPPGQRLRKPHT